MRDGKQTLTIESCEIMEDSILVTLTDGVDAVQGKMWLSDKQGKDGRTAAAKTIEALVKIGFKGQSLAEVEGDTLRGLSVWATIETHPDYGQQAKWIDPPKAQTNFSHLDQLLRAEQQKAGRTQPLRQAQRPPQQRQAPPRQGNYSNELGMDDAEVPF